MTWTPRNTVVVPVDFSETSAPSIRTAIDLAAEPAAVHVIHVIPGLDTVSPLAVWGDEDAEKTLVENALKYLKNFLSENDIAGVTTSIEVGYQGDRIVEYADEHHADLIVIPSHGYHGLQRAIMGSVAERVIRHANVATLVLRRD